MSNKLNTTKRNLKKLQLKLKNALVLSNGSASDEVNRLIAEIRNIAAVLSRSFSGRRLRRILGAAAFVVGLASTNVIAQNQFSTSVENPFGMALGGVDVYFPTFVDLDADGDLDFMGVGIDYDTDLSQWYYKENIGDVNNPQFAAAVEQPFNLADIEGYNAISFADVDQDGDLDLFAGNDYGLFRYFENVGDAQNPSFNAPLDNPFGIYPVPADFQYFSFIDIDSDDDLDITTYRYNLITNNSEPVIYINESDDQLGINFVEGNASDYNLDQMVGSPFSFINYADMDADGDVDALTIEYYYGDIKYYENTASAGEAASFGAPITNPFGYNPEVIGQPSGLVLSTADTDGDGDVDFFLSGDFNNPSVVYYFENGTVSSTDKPQLFAGKFTAYPNPVSGEVIILKSDMKIERVELISTLGQSLNIEFKGDSVYLPSGLSAGQYVIKAEMENGQVAIQRITKK